MCQTSAGFVFFSRGITASAIFRSCFENFIFSIYLRKPHDQNGTHAFKKVVKVAQVYLSLFKWG